MAFPDLTDGQSRLLVSLLDIESRSGHANRTYRAIRFTQGWRIDPRSNGELVDGFTEMDLLVLSDSGYIRLMPGNDSYDLTLLARAYVCEVANDDAALNVTGDQRRQLVDALLKCGMVADRSTRNTIVEQLPSDVRFKARRSDRDREDVISVVTSALQYPGGLTELIKAVRWHEGDSLAMRDVDKLLGTIFSQAAIPVTASVNFYSPYDSVSLIVPIDVATFEIVLKSIIERTGSRSDDHLHLFRMLPCSIRDAPGALRVAMWLDHPDQIIRSVSLPADTIVNVDPTGPDDGGVMGTEIESHGTILVELTHREEVLDAIMFELVSLDKGRTEVLVTQNHPIAREYRSFLIKEIQRRYPDSVIDRKDA